ncbi:transcription repressor NadR [Aquibacillus koreensis]|uniref:Transcription repressor NadR n=1 Tax=Aquibacillus koreensis TaxID=279446 RepID=A0A9X4AGY2_9BACI|nr:transcription repressor NadR [Aquibacillus koreensis]MCT2537970.1 transcription repressor NadR [Aquibacillus koreensis]MDC3419139.1 transcription repressor NadR [Aquibacillus koreensis]
MRDNRKVSGENRRNKILQWLKEKNRPITGGELATMTNVSRQVIVQDISLLKAKNEPIIATSQGYMFMAPTNNKAYERVVACNHTREETRKELYLMVDHGVTVKNVFIEHPVYGDLEASIMVSNRSEVDHFIKQVEETKAVYLLELTNGIHLHTLEADSEEKLELAYQSLCKAGLAIDA